MSDQKIFYVYKSSLSHNGILHTPGARVDVTGIPEKNLKDLRKSGVLISAAEKRALERAAQLAKESREGWIVGTGKDGFMPEPKLAHQPSGKVRSEVEALRSERGEEPTREIEEPVFEDEDQDEDELLNDEDDDPDMFPEDDLLEDEDA